MNYTPHNENDAPENDPQQAANPANVPVSTADEPPRFGLVDVVEAFTAMRHEWRGQSRENRASLEALQTAIQTIQDLEESLQQQVSQNGGSEQKQLIELVAETDHELTRAIAAMDRTEQHDRQQLLETRDAIVRFYRQLSPWTRWGARPLFQFVERQLESLIDRPAASTGREGLQLVHSRLRNRMRDFHLVRLDTEGEMFDPETMHAIDSVDFPETETGQVVEQISPGYLWKDEVLRFANVRVAR